MRTLHKCIFNQCLMLMPKIFSLNLLIFLLDSSFCFATIYDTNKIDVTNNNDLSIQWNDTNNHAVKIANTNATGIANLIVEGNVGIGVTVPVYKLDINGDLNLASGSNYRIGGIIQSGGSSQWIAGSGNDIYRNIGNIGIGTSAPNANAILDVYSTTQGFIPPRMTTTQKLAIVSPTEGMMIYDTTLHKLCVYTNSWETGQSLFSGQYQGSLQNTGGGAWSKIRIVTVTAPAQTLPVNYSVRIGLTTSTTPTASDIFNNCLSNGNDLRIEYYNGTNWIEIDRFIQTFTASQIDIWFKLQVGLSAGTNSGTTYRIVYSNSLAGVGKSNLDNVFTKNYGETGLLALWHIDEGFGTTSVDSSGNGRTLTITGNSQWQGIDGGQWDGQTGTQFNSGSFIKAPSNDAVANATFSETGLPTGSSARTVSVWFRGTSTSHHHQIFRYGTVADPYYRMQGFNVLSTDALNVDRYGGGSSLLLAKVF